MSSVHARKLPVAWDIPIEPVDDSMRTCSADSGDLVSRSMAMFVSTL